MCLWCSRESISRMGNRGHPTLFTPAPVTADVELKNLWLGTEEVLDEHCNRIQNCRKENVPGLIYFACSR